LKRHGNQRGQNDRLEPASDFETGRVLIVALLQNPSQIARNVCLLANEFLVKTSATLTLHTMKRSPNFLLFVLLAAGMLMFRFQAGAQSFDLLVTGSSDSVQLGDTLVYTITVTNLNYASQTYSVFVTNVLPDSVRLISATANKAFSQPMARWLFLRFHPSLLAGLPNWC
jgi:uncharacterized repeat protein (TIGR01451 family)